jgi:hypothetical protein
MYPRGVPSACTPAIVCLVAACGRVGFHEHAQDAAPPEPAFTELVLQTAGLVAYWPFDGDLRDLGPHRRDAVPRTTVVDAIGTCPGLGGGQGVFLENRGDERSFLEVVTPVGSVFDTPSFTIVVWAKLEILRDPVDTDVWNSLVDRNSLWYTSVNSVDLGGGSHVGYYVVRLYDATTPAGGGTGQIGVAPAEPVAILPDAWHMYALAFDGAEVRSYLDGQLLHAVAYAGPVGPTTDTPAPPWGNFHLTWGAWQQRGDWFTGCFDDTAYFDRALTASELAMLHVAKQNAAGG